MYTKTKKVKLSNLIYYMSFFAYEVGTILKVSMLGQSSSVQLMCTFLRYISIGGTIVSIFLRKKYKKNYALMAALIVLVFTLVKVSMGDHGGLLMFIILIGAWGTEGETLGKLYLASSGLIAFASWALSQVGIIQDLTVLSYRTSGNTYYRHAFGLTWSTMFSTVVYFIMATFFYLNGNKKLKSYQKLFIALIAVYISYYTYQGTKGRLEFFMCLLIIVYFLFLKVIWEKFCKTRVGYFFTVYSFIICFVISMTVTLLYKYNPRRFALLNWFMTGRLNYAVQAIRKYGWTLFGSRVEMIGGGSFDVVTTENYFYVDSFYINWMIVYGVVLMVVLAIFFVWLTDKIYKREKWDLLFYIVVVFVHGIIISSIMQPQFNPFLCIAVAEISSRSIVLANEKENHPVKRLTRIQKVKYSQP